jgi:hypothetical protein
MGCAGGETDGEDEREPVGRSSARRPTKFHDKNGFARV